jgi:hypothetical protein
VELYLHFPICFHDIVLNLLGTETNLPFRDGKMNDGGWNRGHLQSVRQERSPIRGDVRSTLSNGKSRPLICLSISTARIDNSYICVNP